MKLTSEMIKQKAAEIGLDAVGIANIERFKGAPVLMDPKSYFPEAKSVIVTLMRIPRGAYRGIEEGTHWQNYTFYGYSKLNSLFRPRLTYALACFIEDNGWEAVPHYPGVPEREPTKPPVAQGRVLPDIHTNIRLMAVGAGLGEMGHSKVFLSPIFGPRVRLGSILTDAELEPDPIIEPGSICNKCGRCVRECPGDAIPPVNDKEKKVEVKIGGKKISWGDVNMGRCVLTHHGMNNRVSPFLKKDYPNLEFDVAKTDITEREGYSITHPMANGKWPHTEFNGPDGAVLKYYSYCFRSTGGYLAICGARGCIRACMDNLEKNELISQRFHNQFYKKESWLLPCEKEGKTGRIHIAREEWLDENYPGIRDGEY